MGRWIGIDYGTRRIGLAISDPGHRIASPTTTLPAAGHPGRDADRVLRWAADQEPGGFVVGLPLNMADGSDSAQTRLTRAFADALGQRGPLPVELWDERLSSFQADQYLDAAGVRPAKRRQLRDALAAQIILQAFLDARRPPDPPAGHSPPEPEPL